MSSQTPIYYVSLPPGAGKTRASIEMMRLHVLNKLRHLEGFEAPRYMFYVAATTKLLLQTLAKLKEVLPEKYADRVRITYSEKGMAFGVGGRSVQKEISNILDGKAADGTALEGPQPWGKNCVLFITHAAFLQLQGRTKMLSQTLVLFDESRKWADIISKLKLDEQAEQYFNFLFSTRPVVDHTGKELNGMSELVAKRVAENLKVKKLKGKSAAAAFKKLDALHRELLPKDGVCRSQAYVTFRNSQSQFKTMVQIRLPSHPFVGLHSAFILSADFETSQMYAFMKDEGAVPRNRSKWFMNTFSEDGYEKAVARAEDRYDYVDIVPLLMDRDPPAINKYYSGGLIIPAHSLKILGDFIRAHNKSADDVHDAIRHVRNADKQEPTKAERDLVDGLRAIGANVEMHDWLVDHAHTVVRLWRKKHPSDTKAIMFLNKKLQRKAKIDVKVFSQVDHGLAVGDNDHRDSNAVVFLASLNPTPDMVRLLKARLSRYGYDPHEDFVVDRAIQSTGRGNIRVHYDTEGRPLKERMLIVASTRGLAERIHARMKSRPNLILGYAEKQGSMQSWDYHTYKSLDSEAAKKRATKAARGQKREWTEDEKKQVARLRVYKSRAAAAGDLDKAADYQSQLDGLKASRYTKGK